MTIAPSQPHCNALRNGNPAMQEVAIPKVSTRSATPNARLDTAGAARPISQRMSSDIGGLSTGAPAYNAGTKRVLSAISVSLCSDGGSSQTLR